MSIRFTGTFVGGIWPNAGGVQPSGKVSKLQIWPVLKGWHVLTSLPKSFYVKFLQSCEGNKTFKSERRMYLIMTYLRCIPQSRTIGKNMEKQPSFQQIKLSMRLCLISNPKSDITEFPFQNTQAIQPDKTIARDWAPLQWRPLLWVNFGDNWSLKKHPTYQMLGEMKPFWSIWSRSELPIQARDTGSMT